MAKVDEYRRYAAECLRLAQQSHTQLEKIVFLQMAKTWHRLAEQAESQTAANEDAG